MENNKNEINEENISTEEVHKKKHYFWIILIIIFILVTALMLLCFNSQSTTKGGINETTTSVESKLFKRPATVSDLNISTKSDSLLGYDYYIIPNVDIDNLEIKIVFEDSNGQSIATKTKKIGPVKKGIQYTVSIPITEFSFTQVLKISQTIVSVTNGTVSYFSM